MDAQTQLKVLRQIPKKTIKIVSSMGIFIVQDKDGVLDVFKKSDIVLLSEKEARLLTQDESTIPEIIERVMISGPKVVILKSGKHGFTMYGRMGTLIVPSYPLAFAVDPTGAGDALGGALAGALAQFNRFDRGSVTTAAVLASIVASFTVEGLGTQSLEDLTVEEVYNRTTVFMGQLPNSDSLRVDVKLKQ
jgi:sugar/nucleoside kinase (ribokinase family)